jgi:hypothetical protein
LRATMRCATAPLLHVRWEGPATAAGTTREDKTRIRVLWGRSLHLLSLYILGMYNTYYIRIGYKLQLGMGRPGPKIPGRVRLALRAGLGPNI